MSLGNRYNIQLRGEKATGLLNVRESGPKITAAKGSPSSVMLWGEKSTILLFCLCFYSLNPEHGTFSLQAITRGFGAEREALEVPEKWLGRKAREG